MGQSTEAREDFPDRSNSRLGEVLRALRVSRGISQEGFAAQLGYGRRTIRRWEAGEAAPDAEAEATIVAFCREQALFRRYEHGPLAGLTLSAEVLSDLIAVARLLLRPQTLRPSRAASSTLPTDSAGAAEPGSSGVTPSGHSGPAPGTRGNDAERANAGRGEGRLPLPTRTLTLLFTDIEESTPLLLRLGSRYREALAAHHRLLREAFQRHGGAEVDTQGDAIFAVFPRATEAVIAACDAQRALTAYPWPEGERLRVRMGVHTGEPQPTEEGYTGIDVVRGARIAAAGHGGQVLLSQTTVELVQHALPAGVALRDLGEHSLKGLPQPERVYQLILDDLPEVFPPLNSLGGRSNNVPLQLTPLLGREQDVTAVTRLLLDENVRLLTLTGPGGIGKTRLAFRAARDLLDHFADGVVVVELAAISDPDLVPTSIAQTLGLREIRGSPLEAVKALLRSKRLLLVLDNFEQILPAAPMAGELLGASPGLKLLVTSRAPLEIRAEHELAVSPLALPDAVHLPPVAALSQYGAVALFIERAAAIKSDFRVTNENAPAVAGVCHRLDGLPLAIELAAARIRLLSPQAMLVRLEHRLPLLTGGSRDLPARQQTLRSTIAWSYDLLDPADQALFRRLAIFSGGCVLQAAEAVGDPDGELGRDVLDGVESLVAKSLLRQAEGPEDEPRFGMLETIREYGLEQLEASGEAAAIRGRHANFFLALAEEAEPHLRSQEQVTWFKRLDAELDNLRAVPGWCRAGAVDAEVGLRLAGALQWYWRVAGRLNEGRSWTEAMLDLPASRAPTAARARALNAAARIANLQDDFVPARSLAQELAALAGNLGDLAGVAHALDRWAYAEMGAGNLPLARPLWEESIALFRKSSDLPGLAIALIHLGLLAVTERRYPEAAARTQESAAIARALGDRSTLTRALSGLSRCW